MSEPSGGHKNAWAVGWVGICVALAIALASIAGSSAAAIRYLVLFLLLAACGAVYLALVNSRTKIRIPSILVAFALAAIAIGVGLSIDPSDAEEPAALSATTTTQRPTVTTTTALSTTPTSTLPTPVGPPLPPQEQVIDESRSAEFFDGALLLANKYTFPSSVALTITTDGTSCTSGSLDVGERAVVAANAAGNRFFRVTVLETTTKTSAHVRVEDLPQKDWPASSPSCPF